MEYQVVWSIRALRTYVDNLTYLEREWTDKEAASFVRRPEEVIHYIQSDPFIYEASTKKANVYRCVVTTHISLYYKRANDKIMLLIFWDNGQNPTRLKY